MMVKNAVKQTKKNEITEFSMNGYFAGQRSVYLFDFKNPNTKKASHEREAFGYPNRDIEIFYFQAAISARSPSP